MKYLMMTFNMKLKSSFGGVFFSTAMIRTRDHLYSLEMTVPYCKYMLIFLVSSHVLFEMLLVEKSFVAARFRTHTVTLTISIMCSHMDIQVTLPVEYSISE